LLVQVRESLLRLLVSVLTGPLSLDEVPADGNSATGHSPGLVLGLTKPYEGPVIPNGAVRKVLEVLTYLCK
jgi:hypothetical protein